MKRIKMMIQKMMIEHHCCFSCLLYLFLNGITRTTSFSPAYILTHENFLHAPSNYLRLPYQYDPQKNSIESTSKLIFSDLTPNAVYQKPNNVIRTGIPYQIIAPIFEDSLSLCFIVEHMGHIQRTCNSLNSSKSGLLIFDRLGKPTITSTLFRQSKNGTSSILVAWNRFTIRIVDDGTGSDYSKKDTSRKVTEGDGSRGTKEKGNNWFDSVVILNLKHRPEMMQQMLEHIRDTQPFPATIPIRRHDAVNGNNVDVQHLHNSGRLTRKAMNHIHQLSGRVEAITMTAGGLGCALSHIEIWEHFLSQSNGGGSILILEDDVRLSPYFKETMMNVQLPNEYDVVYLSFPDFGRRMASPFTNFTSTTTSSSFSTIRRVYGDNWGTGGYIVSLKGIQTLLKHVYPIDEQIDSFLVSMVELGWNTNNNISFVAYMMDSPILIREIKSLHVSDIQRY
jgi:GR25 family glycosyltransferase involved in LPS biosynthesis